MCNHPCQHAMSIGHTTHWPTWVLGAPLIVHMPSLIPDLEPVCTPVSLFLSLVSVPSCRTVVMGTYNLSSHCYGGLDAQWPCFQCGPISSLQNEKKKYISKLIWSFIHNMHYLTKLCINLGIINIFLCWF